MKLHILDMPDRPAALAEWLEQILVGEQLGIVVAELKALIDEPLDVAVSVESVVGESLDVILEQGLRQVGPAVLNRLIAQPSSLVDLQDQVFIHGGNYWQRLIRNTPSDDRGTERSWAMLESAIRQAEPVIVPQSRKAGDYGRRTELGVRASRERSRVALRRVRVAREPPTSGGHLGLELPTLASKDVSASDYLRNLANAGEAWTKKRPTTTRDVAQRLNELRQGCTKLILADHAPLEDEDRQWLIGKCREWAGKFDQQLVALEALGPNDDPLPVRNEIDAIVEKLAKALRDRAESIGAG